VHQWAWTQRLYNPVYSLLTILLFGVIFFSLAAKGYGRIMEQGAIELVEGVVMAVAEHAEEQTTKWALKLLIDIDCWNDHIADCALARFFHERRCETRS
jgi:hypothetical protein